MKKIINLVSTMKPQQEIEKEKLREAIKKLALEYAIDDNFDGFEVGLVDFISALRSQDRKELLDEIESKIPAEIDKDQAWNKLCALNASGEAMDEAGAVLWNTLRSEILTILQSLRQDNKETKA